MNMFWVFAD